MSTIEIVALILVIALLLVVIFVYVPWRVRSSRSHLVWILREHNATSEETAITLDQLHIQTGNIFTMRTRDFNKEALSFLISSGVVRRTEDDRLYLLDEKLMETNPDKTK